MHSHQSNASYSDFAALDLTAVFGRDASRNKNPNILSVHEPSDAIARLAAWMIALTVGVISLPLGVFVIICNLFRGEDFRLSAHSLALAGVVSVLNTSGAMAHALGRVFS